MAELELHRTEEALNRALEARESVVLICYLPFGIVRGTVRRSADISQTQIGIKQSDPVLKLHDTIVEQYSSHLPTGLHKVFYVRMKKISGYVLAEE